MASIGGRRAMVRRALRHRAGQSVGLLLLAVLISAAVSFAPLSVRAIEQSVVRLDLTQHPVAQTGLTMTSVSGPTSDGSQNWGPDKLLGLVPPSIRRHFGPPALTREAQGEVGHSPRGALSGQVLWARAACAHLRFVTGRCPAKQDDIAISDDDRRVLHLQVGDVLDLTALNDLGNPGAHRRMRVVGVYRQIPGRYWFGRVLAGKAGAPGSGPTGGVQHDDWITVESTFTTDDGSPLPGTSNGALLPIDRAHTGVEQLRALGPPLRRLEDRIATGGGTSRVDVVSGLPDLIEDLTTQQHQAMVTVPLVVLQLALLGLFVLWLVLGALTDQRRNEVALALLRGRGRRGARRQLFTELAVVTLAGVPVGGAIAAILCAVCRHTILPGHPPFELRWPFWASLAGVAVALAALIAVAVELLTRQPVDRLLRRVPSRHSPLGVPQALLLAAAATGSLAFVTGALSGTAALAGPALLALLVGVVLSLLTMPVAAAYGRRLLRSGRAAAALTMFDAARSPALRRTLAVLTVATALLVFATDAAVVGSRNRQAAAAQYVGAPRVLTVAGNDLAGVRAALGHADPHGRSATPVVTVQPPGTSVVTTLAVVPRQFRRIAELGDVHLPTDRLRPPPAAPLRIVGDHIVLRVLHSAFGKNIGGGSNRLTMTLLTASGGVDNLTLGTIPRNALGPITLSTPVSCVQGCLLYRLGVAMTPGAGVSGELTLGPLRVHRAGSRTTTVDIAGTGLWHRAGDETQGTDGTFTATPRGGRLVLDVGTDGPSSVNLEPAWFPREIPALLSGTMPAGHRGDVFPVAGLDAQTRDAHRVASLPRVPSAPHETAVVDLDTVSRGALLDGDDQIQVWLGRDDPQLERAVTTALTAHHLRVIDSESVAARRTFYDRSAAAWALDLGVATGVVALLIALAVMVVVTATGRRTRTHDLAALRMTGIDARRLRRVAVAHYLIAVLLAVLAGSVTGAIGAQLALGSIPMFARRPSVSTLNMSLAWPALIAATVLSLVLLGTLGVHLGRRIALAAHLTRLREAE